MQLIYNVEDKPRFRQLIIFSLQQLLAIMAATIAVPAIIGNGMTSAAALFGAGAGTLVYVLLTRRKSPVFLGSSFAFLGSMAAAFAGGISASVGFLGLIIGAFLAGLVYVILALIVKLVGVEWISKLMPPVVIGPTVAIIGLSLSGNAVKDLVTGSYKTLQYGWANGLTGTLTPTANTYLCLLCGLVTLATIIVCSTVGKKMMRLIPFVIGIGAGYLLAAVFTVIGILSGNDALRIIDFAPILNLYGDSFGFTSFLDFPKFAFLTAFSGDYNFGTFGDFWGYLGTVAVAYIPVAFVVFAEHIADHKNLSSIIGRDLLKEPGLDKTLLGDGVGSMVGALFGGCPNTTYGESVGCVAITKNASVLSIIGAAVLAIGVSFVSPFVALLSTIPSCVMGGVCISLYGFIAVSGLKMIQKVNLDEHKNLFTVCVILIAGVGGLSLTFGKVTLTSVACALILGVLTNVGTSFLLAKTGKNGEEEDR